MDVSTKINNMVMRMTMLTLFVVLALAITASPSVHASGVVGSGTPGSCTEAALDAALSGGGIVTFNCGPSPHTITTSSTKVIAADTSLDGGGLITISGGNAVRVFNVNPGAHLSLASVTINGGKASGGSGGAIANQGRLTITDSSFVGNEASFHGGAILNYGSLDLNDSYFAENAAGINGGAIDSTVTLTVTRSIFEGNNAGFRGGGINNYLGDLTVLESTFQSNHAGLYGGGLVNDGGTAFIAGASILTNTAQAYGGGVRNSGTLTVIDTTIADNTAAGTGGGLENSGTLSLENSTLSSNSADSSGGGIENSSGASATITHGTLLNNEASSASGGNITNSGFLQLQSSVVSGGSILNCLGSLTSLGNNLESATDCGFTTPGDMQNTDPLLDGLRDNGGPTLTHAPRPGSPVLDRIPPAGCLPTDQRGLPRPQGGQCDTGAVELDAGFRPSGGDMPWPMLAHDARHTGRGIAPGPDDARVLGTPWPYLAGARIATAAAIGYDGTAYVGSEDGALHAVGRNGTQRFVFKAGAAVRSSPALVPAGYGPVLGEPWTPPTTSTVYFGADDGHVYSLDSSGGLLWSLLPGSPPNTSPVRSSPVVFKAPASPLSRVYVGANSGKLYAIFETGSHSAVTAWEVATGAPLDTSPALSPDGEIVYVGGTDGKLYCLDAITGAALPETPIDLGQGALTTPAVDEDGQVYVATAAGRVHSYDPQCRPRRYWHVNLPGSIASAPALSSNGQVLVLSGNELYWLSNLGDLLWSQSFPRPVGQMAPIVDSVGTAYVASSDGWLYAVAQQAGSPSGTIAWAIEVRPGGSGFLAQPAMDGYGRIYLGSSDQELNVIDDEPAFQIAFHSDLSAPANLDIYTLRETDGVLDPARTLRLTDHPASERQPAYSLDRSVMAFVSDSAFGDDLLLANAIGAEPVILSAPRAGAPFSATSDEAAPAFTPIDDETGVPRLADGWRYLAVSTDVSGLDRIVFLDLDAHRRGVTRVLTFSDWATVQGVPPALIAQLEPAATAQSAVAFAPDGKHLAWRDCDPDGVAGQVLLLALKGANSEIFPVGAGFYDPEVTLPCHDSPTFSPDSRWLAVREGNELAIYDIASVSSPALSTQGPGGALPLHPNWSPDGSQIAVGAAMPGGAVDLFVMTGAKYKTAQRLTSTATSDEPFFQYYKMPAPHVSFVNPDRQGPGDLVQVFGRGFDILRPLNNQVFFTDTLHATWLPAEVVGGAVDPVEGLGVLTVRVPDLAGNGQIKVQTRFGTATWGQFYVLPRPVSVIQPRSVPGAKIRVFGTGFDLTPATQYQVLFAGAGGGWVPSPVLSGAISGHQEYLVVEVPAGIAESGPIRVQNAQGSQDCACTFAQLHPTFSIQRSTGLPAYAQQGCAGIEVTVAGSDFPYDPEFGYGTSDATLTVVNINGAPQPVTFDPRPGFSPTGPDMAGFGPLTLGFIQLPETNPGGDLDVQASDTNLPPAVGHAAFRVPLTNLPIIFVAGTSGVSLDTGSPFLYTFPGDVLPHAFPWICRTCLAGYLPHAARVFTYAPGLQDPAGPRVWLGPEAIETMLLELPNFNRGNHYLDVLRFDGSGANTLFPNIVPGSVMRTVNLSPLGVLSMEFYEPLFDYLLNTLGRPLESGPNGVYPFLYDWRGDMSDQAANLGTYVDWVLAQTGADKVVLITHSLGGPVARAYYLSAPANADKVDQVISMGGGFGGATKGIKILGMGDTWGFGWGSGPLTVGFAEWQIESLAQDWGTAYFQAPNSDLWFADDVSRGGAYDRRYVIDDRLLATPVGRTYSDHMTWLKNTYNGTIATRASDFFDGLNPALGDFGGGTGPVYHHRLMSLGLDTPSGLRLSTGPSSYCLLLLAIGSPSALVECPLVATWREPLLGDGDGTVTYHGMLGQTDPADDRVYILRNVEHADLTKQSNVHDLIGSLLDGSTCAWPQSARFGFTNQNLVTERYAVPPSQSASRHSGAQMSAEADHWLLQVHGVAELDIVDDSGRHVGRGPDNPMLFESTIPGIYSNPGLVYSYVSLTEAGFYTLTLSGTTPSALDISITPSAGGTPLETTLYQGVPLTGTSQAQLLLDTINMSPNLELDFLGDGNIESIPPTSILEPEEILDHDPPITSISIEGRQVTLSASDNPGGSGVLRTYYSLDSEPFQIYTQPFTLPPDARSVTAFSMDRNGNLESPGASLIVDAYRTYLPLVTRR